MNFLPKIYQYRSIMTDKNAFCLDKLGNIVTGSDELPRTYYRISIWADTQNRANTCWFLKDKIVSFRHIKV